MRGKSFFRMHIKLACACVPLNSSVELRGVEGFKPRAKPRQLARGKLFDGFLDVFGGGHVKDIALGRDAEKGVERSHKTHAAHEMADRVALIRLFRLRIEDADFAPQLAGLPILTCAGHRSGAEAPHYALKCSLECEDQRGSTCVSE
jgi:hypothetical protein